MFNELLSLDQQLYLWVNQLPHWPVVNIFFILLDLLTYAGIAWGIFCLALLILGNKTTKKLAIYGLLVVLFTALLEGVLLKRVLVRRPRPFWILPAQVWGIKPNSFSFPSGQTAGAFSAAVFYSLVFRKKKLTAMLLLLAFLVGVMRVYLGAHYPLDVLGGIIIGSVCGWSFYLLTSFYESKLRRQLHR